MIERAFEFFLIGVMGMGVLLCLFLFGVSCYGLYCAFSASIILGFCVLFLEPAPLILGLVHLFTNIDLVGEIVTWLNLPI